MKDNMKDLASKLDSLKSKTKELVKERDLAKDQVEEVRIQLGVDLLNGVQIDEAGEALTKAKARIQTLNSAIESLTSSMTVIQASLFEEQKQKAEERSKEIRKEVFDKVRSVGKDFKSLAFTNEEIQVLLSELRLLANTYKTGVGLPADNISGLASVAEQKLKDIRRIDESVYSDVMKG